ncbi:conjugal transfer protein TraN [Actimicrobium sp. CCI2.3]|uniref:conjugal transfer protein TraN n=1 Tax=Actimicrobium sp. CCI2.3 TaxID=3048616 RepID=UPI002AB47C97|nr:conjugal transfer protein TraN [Actimicrobium sp. CCI2.3]MDY7574448.1 conjugal transfer protein TraN [Actimicrobium sp. CCI2.3]MEB0022474.1 conjugal transfer protein TraN [Actimicrobium sp. CCI2.3]
MKSCTVYLTIMVFLSHQLTVQAAPGDEGREVGASANAEIRGMVDAPSARSVVPGYTTTPPEVGLAGSTTLKEQGAARLRACDNTSADPVCQAQHGAAVSAGVPRAPVSASDASVAATRDLQRNPAAALGDLSSYYGSCLAASQPSTGQCCIGGNCFNTAYASDTDFARTVTFMEAAREAGVYLDTARMQVFRGEDDRCRDRLFKNCCTTNSAGAGMTNQSLFGVGSRVVYDVLMNADNREFVYRGARALLTGAGFDGAFTTYGVTVAVNGTALPAGSVLLSSGESFAVAFDPWSLAFAVVLTAAISTLSCSRDEGLLSLKKGAALCHDTGSWCSSCIRVFGKCVSCIEHTHSHCCFNSRLARMINEQGRTQVGKGWGGAQNPDCSGFTIAQLQRLDFAAMDLTEFYASVVPTLPNVQAVQGAAAGRVGRCADGRGRC